MREPYFFDLLTELVKDKGEVSRSHKIEVLPGVTKIFDFLIKIGDRIVRVELKKKNIDMVEKDLFKWSLLKGARLARAVFFPRDHTTFVRYFFVNAFWGVRSIYPPLSVEGLHNNVLQCDNSLVVTFKQCYT